MLHRYVFVLFCLLSGFFPVSAQLSIQFPVSRFVTQRDLNNQGRIYIAARLSEQADRVEAQLTPIAAGQGTQTAWQVVQQNATAGVVMGSMTGAGGWYTLSVRAVRNGLTVAQTTVQPVGIGEVFITAGQSNSRGFGLGDNDLGAISDRVSTFDTINHYYPTNFPALLSSGDPMPFASYVPLTAGKRIFPMGESSWGWGELGDYLVNRLNVPVLFYNVGWDASTIDNWNGTAKGVPGCNRYYCVQNWPFLQPYTNLKNVLGYYAATGGFRAVLWHQGESEYGDANSGTVPLYAARLDSLIRQTRRDFNNRPMAWMVARASFNGQTTNPDVVVKQQQVIQTPNLTVFEGPLNDTIINRLSGQSDVHFGNALRPSPHPQYFLNNQPIPANMGISRFARNWNNSLNDAFFQNAPPLVPLLFASTGDVTATTGGAFAPGDSVRVAFVQSGTFNAGNQWDVQILDSKGRFRATVGRGATSPLQVRWPDSLAAGTYRVRVVSTNPVMAAAPTPLLMVFARADLSLTSSVRRQVLAVNDTTTISVTTQNDGQVRADQFSWQCRLPANLVATATSGAVTITNGIVSGTLTTLNPGERVTQTFRVQPSANGQYRLAIQISQATNADPDSQPNSGTGDGQDDATQLEIRVGNGGGTYASPNPNQTPLPTVRSNQPTPAANLADLSLRMQASNRTPALNELVTFTLVVTNTGGATASSVNTTAYLPTGMAFVDSDNMAPGGGGITGTALSIPAGSSASLSFRARVTTIGMKQTQAQVRVVSPADSDSTPGNGYPTSTGEDDEATVDLRVR